MPRHGAEYTARFTFPSSSSSSGTGISPGAPPHVTTCPPAQEQRIYHVPARYTKMSQMPSPSKTTVVGWPEITKILASPTEKTKQNHDQYGIIHPISAIDERTPSNSGAKICARFVWTTAFEKFNFMCNKAFCDISSQSRSFV
jgi:hypothetical protein